MNSSPYNDDYFIDQLIERLKTSLDNLRFAIDRKDNASINLSSLDTRTRNIFIKYHIQDYLALSRCEANNIVKWKYCGKKTIQNIIKIMDEFSYSEMGTTDNKDSTVSVAHKNHYYFASKIDEILDEKYYLDYVPSEEEFDTFGKCAVCIAENINDYIEAYKRNALQDRDVEIFRDYIIDDMITMEVIGQKYNLTRERIRQLLLKYRKRLSGCFHKDEYRAYSDVINDCLLTVPYEGFMHFIAYGLLTQYSKRFTLFAMQCLFGNVLAENILAVASNLIYACPPINRADSKVEELLQKACFPSASYADLIVGEIECAEDTGSHTYIEKLYLRLRRCNKLKAVIRKPKIVYYVTSSTEHVPDFGLLTQDGKFILVVALPTINMAIRYNLNRFNALHKFCKENGYGYIITDDRFNSIYDIKHSELNSELEQSLLRILDKFGRIGWSDIQKLKSKFRITNATIAAFVMQNNLNFSLNPFVITNSGDKVKENKEEALSEIQDKTFQVDLAEIEDEYNERSAVKGIANSDNFTVKVGKYDFICDESGEILTDSELFEELRKLRWDLAEETGVPKFYIFGNAQLIGLATYKPTNVDEWLAIKGLGPGKFNKYGAQFIEIIKKYKK